MADSTIARSKKARFTDSGVHGILRLMRPSAKNLTNLLDVEQNPPLRVVMVYEDFEMAVQARKVCDLIVEQSGVGAEVQLSVWRFDSFGSGDLRNAVGRQADQADVIVVAPRNLDRLPAEVDAWLRRWSTHRHAEPGAFVAVFHPEAAREGTASRVALRLWRAADRAGMDFFSGTPDWTVRGRSSAVETPPTPRLDFVRPVGTTPGSQHCSLGWGIDE